MKLIFKTIAPLLIFAATGCNDAIKSSQVPGVYKANFLTKGIYLYIFKNGTCKFQDSLNQKVDIKMATWKFNGKGIDVQMADTGGIWPAQIQNANGKVRIVYAEEEGLYFDKIQSF